jgi:hypothetical protein
MDLLVFILIMVRCFYVHVYLFLGELTLAQQASATIAQVPGAGGHRGAVATAFVPQA